MCLSKPSAPPPPAVLPEAPTAPTADLSGKVDKKKRRSTILTEPSLQSTQPGKTLLGQ